jgi:hypothetical protein
MVDAPNPEDSKKSKAPKGAWEAKLKPHWVEVATLIILGVVGVFQIGIYWRQANIMQSQADIAAQQNKIAFAAQRAWIDAPKMKIVRQPDPTKIRFAYKFTNFGHTPTTGLHIDGGFIKTLNPGEAAKREKAITDYCNEGMEIALKTTSEWSTVSIIPNGIYSWDQPTVAGGLRSVWTLIPVLVGCVVYGPGLADNKPVQTGFWAEVHYGELTEGEPTIYGPYARSPN